MITFLLSRGPLLATLARNGIVFKLSRGELFRIRRNVSPDFILPYYGSMRIPYIRNIDFFSLSPKWGGKHCLNFSRKVKLRPAAFAISAKRAPLCCSACPAFVFTIYIASNNLMNSNHEFVTLLRQLNFGCRVVQDWWLICQTRYPFLSPEESHTKTNM